MESFELWLLTAWKYEDGWKELRWRNQKKYMKWILGVNKSMLGYMVRKEL